MLEVTMNYEQVREGESYRKARVICCTPTPTGRRSSGMVKEVRNGEASSGMTRGGQRWGK